MDPNEKSDEQKQPQRSASSRRVTIGKKEPGDHVLEAEAQSPPQRGAFKSRRRMRSLRRLVFINRLLASSGRDGSGVGD